MVRETRWRYRCKQNDNQILLDCVDGYLDELCVGSEDSEGGGWIIVGAVDLRRALGKAGYELKRRPYPKEKGNGTPSRLPSRIRQDGERVY